MGSATVRRATAADVPRIIELCAQLSLDRPRELDPADPVYQRAFADIEADPRQMLLVVAVADVVVGTATLSFLPNLSHGGRPVAQIESVVVDAAARGQGAGEALVGFCLEEARRRGCFRVQLTSDLRRADAHRFWERAGFVHTHAGYKLAL